MSSPRTRHEIYAVKVRERFDRMTPFRLGLVIGEAGEELPSPYPADTRGDRHYQQGLEVGRMQRRNRMDPPPPPEMPAHPGGESPLTAYFRKHGRRLRV